MDLNILVKALVTKLKTDLPGNVAHEPMRAVAIGELKPDFGHKIPPKPGSVLILLYEENGVLKFPLIKRNEYVGAHSGQISLPGGKTEAGENAIETALREAEEESGLKNFKLLQETIFDIDIHRIPERKDFAEHFHYDVRFLFQASMDEPIVISEESHDVAWKKISEIADLTQHNPSMIRMAEKTVLL